MLFVSPGVPDFVLNDNSGTNLAPGGYCLEEEEEARTEEEEV